VLSAHAGVEREAAADASDRATGGLRLAAVLGRAAVWLRPAQVAVELGGGAPATVTLPLSLGLQLTRGVWAQADVDVQVGELQGGRLVRAAAPSVPAAIAAVVSLRPSLDLRVRLAGELDGGGPRRTVSWLAGLGWILGG
jgi:hypothetical protein